MQPRKVDRTPGDVPCVNCRSAYRLKSHKLRGIEVGGLGALGLLGWRRKRHQLHGRWKKFPRRSWDRCAMGGRSTTARKVEVCVVVRVHLARAGDHWKHHHDTVRELRLTRVDQTVKWWRWRRGEQAAAQAQADPFASNLSKGGDASRVIAASVVTESRQTSAVTLHPNRKN